MYTKTILLLFLLCGREVVWSVRLLEVRVPSEVPEGSDAILGCSYDMEGDRLYSVKWYKDNAEFYRYVPKRYPDPISAFDKPGIHVNKSRSSDTVVVLENLTRESEGYYVCEVSGESPTFTTVRNSKHITVHYLPESGPRITGAKSQYFFDDLAIINCTSPASRPAAQLRWLVNGQPAARRDLQDPWQRDSDERPDALETTLQLRFVVATRHFVNGAMRLTCQATIPPLYMKETNSTHYIALPYTRTTEKNFFQDVTDSSYVTRSRAAITLLCILPLMLQIYGLVTS